MKTSKVKYGSKPLMIASNVRCKPKEMLLYQYLPIKMKGLSNQIYVPSQLQCFNSLINIVKQDFIRKYGQKSFEKHYMYITAKRMYVTSNSNLNRPGWHSDGFGTPDINYIWCDSIPTEYIEGDFEYVPADDTKALTYFENIGNMYSQSCMTEKIKVNAVYRLDETVIHATSFYNGDPTIRTFIKISFSKKKYNLKDNSHNYLIDYNWIMKNRTLHRNHPNK